MRKIISVTIVVFTLLALCGCSLSEKAIVGTWKNQKTVLGVVTETGYTFNDDRTGKISSVVDVSFTYTIEDGKLTITTSTLGIKNSTEYTYEFSGSKLILTNGDETIELEKSK